MQELPGNPPVPPDEWVIKENITVTLIDYTEEEDGPECTTILVSRIDGPGAYVLTIDGSGMIAVNGRFVYLGEDGPCYWGIFDQTADHFAAVRQRQEPTGESFVMEASG